MSRKQIRVLIALVVILVGMFFYFTKIRTNNRAKNTKQIQLETSTPQAIQNEGPVNPITGKACDNWDRRLVAIMQPSDLQARPAAGFSEADMIFEMPAYTSSVTRLMGVYGCTIPKEIGAIRSSRHDYIALAKGINAFFIHWGGSHFALDLLKQNVIDHIDCMNTNYCARWTPTGKMRMEDTGYITGENVLTAMKNLSVDMKDKFVGYPHQAEALLDQRPESGHLRVAFAKPFDVEYDYDKNSNTYLRNWDGETDVDRNNQQRLAPKNIVVMFARSEQITNTQDYTGKGLRSPWENVEEIKNTGVESISGRYNNVEIGDPWYDESDSGEAYYYMNGKQYHGNWKKDKSSLDSKLFFYGDDGKEIPFVPGQIWVEILEPGQALRWTSPYPDVTAQESTPQNSADSTQS